MSFSCRGLIEGKGREGTRKIDEATVVIIPDWWVEIKVFLGTVSIGAKGVLKQARTGVLPQQRFYVFEGNELIKRGQQCELFHIFPMP